MMRRHLTHPDANLVHVGKATPDALVAGRRPAGAAPALCPDGVRSTRLGGVGMEPTRLFPIIALLSWSPSSTAVGAAGCPSPGTARWGAFRERFFAAGHTHAGVVLVLSLTYFIYL